MSSEFQIKRHEPAYIQVTQHLRQLILAGEWVPGSRLPPIQQMAKQFGTNYRTVHIALTPLVKEGLIVRVHGSGTFVRERSGKLTCVGIYFASNVLEQPSAGYYQALYLALQKALATHGIESSIWIDTRPEEQQSAPMPALVQAIERREIQAVAVGLVPPVAVAGLERLPVPTCFTGGAIDPRKTSAIALVDQAQMLEASLGELRRLGCRSAGLITHIHTVPNERDRQFHRHLDFFEAFLAAAAVAGIETRSPWIMAPQNPVPVTEKFGYDQFRQLWLQPERPEGVVVFPDILARGVVAAGVELGIHVPRDLKLVFHRNAGVEFICPLPVSWIETDVARIADAVAGLLLRQSLGESVRPVHVPFRLYPLGEPGTRN